MGSSGELYEIRIGGVIDSTWIDWFDGMEIRPAARAETLITGRLSDRAALRGLLDRIADLNLDLISVNRVEEEGKR